MAFIPLIKLEEIAERMCDGYCKYPHQYDEDNEGQPLGDSDICNNCPMTEMLKEALSDEPAS